MKIVADKELAALKKVRNKLENEIAQIKRNHRKNEYTEVNTYQLFVLEERLKMINKKIEHRELMYDR